MTEIHLLRYEVIFHWIAVFFYILSMVLFTWSVFFQKEKWLNIAVKLTLSGLVPHSVALGIRWYAVGHGPYLMKYEAFSSIVWVVILMFLVISYQAPKLKSTGIVVLPCSILTMALGLFANPGVKKLPPTFRSIWLWIHIGFTKLALGAILISLGSAIFYLLKNKRGNESYKKLPSIEVLDAYSYKFAGFGFVFWTITVIAGAIWANEAWGRYWGWDPIETWSLITWLLFGFYLHLRRFFGWQGSKAAYLMVICFLFSIVALFVIPFVMPTIHSEFFL